MTKNHLNNPDHGHLLEKRKKQIDSQAINTFKEKSMEKNEEITQTNSVLDNKSLQDLKNLKEELLSQRTRRKTPIRISLLSFADFVSENDSKKINFVRKFKLKTENPRRYDYWSPLRIAIGKLHKGVITLDEFQELSQSVPSEDRANYAATIKAYLEFLKNKKFKWFKPFSTVWIQGQVGIRIKHDFGVLYNNQKVLLMLYIRKEPLSDKKTAILLTLLKNGLQLGEADYRYWVLDVKSQRLFKEDKIDQSIMPALRREAFNFEKLWILI